MFSFCSDPEQLGNARWMACYLTTGVHLQFYAAFFKVLLLLAITAPVALGFGFVGAMSARSRVAPLAWLGKIYIAVVRGVPDIAFFLFFVIALDQGFEYLRHRVLCPDWDQPVRQGSDFIVCQAAKLPLGTAPEWMHETYGFFLAVGQTRKDQEKSKWDKAGVSRHLGLLRTLRAIVMRKGRWRNIARNATAPRGGFD